MFEANPYFLEALMQVAEELPPHAVDAMAQKISKRTSLPPLSDAPRFANTAGAVEAIRRLFATAREVSGLTPATLSVALGIACRTIARIAECNRLEIAWTGPNTTEIAPRRVDQVLYQLITDAQDDILLVSYVTHNASLILSALRTAIERGVRVQMVLETVKESGGHLQFDGVGEIRSAVQGASLYCWPLSMRPVSEGGKTGIMHVKCGVFDRKKAFVASANLTDKALESNMELGLLTHNPLTAARLARHFEQLIARKQLELIR